MLSKWTALPSSFVLWPPASSCNKGVISAAARAMATASCGESGAEAPEKKQSEVSLPAAPVPEQRQVQEESRAVGSKLYFGKWPLDPREVFAETEHSLAIVNLKPVVPGHVLVLSKRIAPRFADLSAEETSDLWLMAQRVGSAIEPHFGASALTFSIQDGVEAGQTVPHVHIHILPRKKGDFANNDDVYGEIEKNEAVLEQGRKKQRMDEAEERKPRSMEDMAAEAARLRGLLSTRHS